MSQEKTSKDHFFAQLGKLADEMVAAHGKDFAMGAMVLAARFIAEGAPEACFVNTSQRPKLGRADAAQRPRTRLRARSLATGTTVCAAAAQGAKGLEHWHANRSVMGWAWAQPRRSPTVSPSPPERLDAASATGHVFQRRLSCLWV
jgi:hypothetical protein